MQQESNDAGKVIDEILDFWFAGTLEEQFQRWFSSGDAQRDLDLLIAEKYGHLLSYNDEGQPEIDFEFDPVWNESARAMVAKILVHDQFARHLYRDQSSEANRAALAECDRKALAWAHQFVSDSSITAPDPQQPPQQPLHAHDRVALFRLPMGQFVFALMPFRHSKLERNLKLVLQMLEEREAMHADDGKLLDRFKKTTIRKLYDATDDESSLTGAPNEEVVILEHFPFAANEEHVDEEKLYLCMQEFLERKWKKDMQYTVVSLSGGVDSMVISKILCLLRPVFGYVLCLHSLLFVFDRHSILSCISYFFSPS
jgi:uncharacterized protein (DUF924 family)